MKSRDNNPNRKQYLIALLVEPMGQPLESKIFEIKKNKKYQFTHIYDEEIGVLVNADSVKYI